MENTTDGDDSASSVEPVFVYTGPKSVARWKMRLAEWLDRKGW